MELIIIFMFILLVILVTVMLVMIMKFVSSQQELKSFMDFKFKDYEGIHKNLQEAQQSLESFRTAFDERKRHEDEIKGSIKRVENIIAGTKSKGIAGENIIMEALREFPSDMIRRNFRVKGQEVEFGLVLPDEKVLPIDCKWPATGLIEKLFKEEDIPERQKLLNLIQKEVENRVKEVSKYIDPLVTTPQAIAAIPDSIFCVCDKVHKESYKRKVILISYSMTIPYLLTFLDFHIQYSKSVDIENLSGYLMDINRNIDEMVDVLENSIIKGSTMISNAVFKYREIISSIKGSISSIEASKQNGDEKKKISKISQ